MTELVHADVFASDCSDAPLPNVNLAFHPELDQAAVDAVSTWRFEPARRCGVAEPGTWLLATRFEVTE